MNVRTGLWKSAKLGFILLKVQLSVSNVSLGNIQRLTLVRVPSVQLGIGVTVQVKLSVNLAFILLKAVQDVLVVKQEHFLLQPELQFVRNVEQATSVVLLQRLLAE